MVPLKGSIRVTITGFYDVGALVIRIGFWGGRYYKCKKILFRPLH